MGDGHANDVAVQGLPCLGGLHVHVVVLAFDNHEDEALAGHLGFADELRDLLAALVSAGLARLLTLVFLFLHTNCG